VEPQGLQLHSQPLLLQTTAAVSTQRVEALPVDPVVARCWLTSSFTKFERASFTSSFSLRAPFSEGISLLLEVVGSRQVVGNKWECWARNTGVTMHL